MDFYAIIESGKDRSNFWAPFVAVYRLCKTEEDAKTILAKMAEECKDTHVEFQGDAIYSNPHLSEDGSKLSLHCHDTCRHNCYINWDLEYRIVQIHNVSKLFSDDPF